MRGAFVACFGGSSDDPRLERAVEALRWHAGQPARYAGHGLWAAVLDGGSDGPGVEANPEGLLLVHGPEIRPLDELQREGQRFAAVACDGRELRASRDPLGLCPLFYRVFDGKLWLSTEIAPLVALGRPRPDLTALSYQVALVPDEVRTGWEGIWRVLPGYTLHATTSLELRTSRYWDPEARVGSYRGGRPEAAAELRHRLLAAARDCANGPTGILLSGGLDSAAVAAAAAEPRLADWLVHVVFPGFQGADEERYARAVADSAKGNLDVVAGELTPWDPEDDLATSSIPYLTPPNLTANSGLARLSELGADIAMDGNDGDGVLGYPGREWGAMALSGHFERLSELVHQYGLSIVLYGIAGDLIPPVVRLRRLRGKPPLDPTYLQHTERYFAEPVRRRMRQADLSRWRFPVGDWKTRQLRQVMPVTTIRMEEHELRAARFGLDMRHPFADRRLVEFLISLPASVKSDPLRSKALLRASLGAVLPDEVLARPDKAHYFDVLAQRLDLGRWLEMLRSPDVRLPMVDYDALYRDAEADPGALWVQIVHLVRAHVFASRG